MPHPILVQKMLLPAIGVFTSSKFARLASAMQRFDRMPAEQIQRQQWESLTRVLRHAYECVPFYRDKFAEAGLRPEMIREPADLLKLPPTTKQEVAAHFPDGITAVGSARQEWRFAATSGTTSQRMIVIQDFPKREAVRAAALRSFQFSGLHVGTPSIEIPPDICSAQCGLNREPEPSLLRYLWKLDRAAWRDRETWSNIRGLVERQVVFRRTTLPSFDERGTNQPEAILDDYVDQIRLHRPAMLKALPTYLLAPGSPRPTQGHRSRRPSARSDRWARPSPRSLAGPSRTPSGVP